MAGTVHNLFDGDWYHELRCGCKWEDAMPEQQTKHACSVAGARESSLTPDPFTENRLDLVQILVDLVGL